MLHLLLAALQIAWSGAGAPIHGGTSVPVLIAQSPEGRTALIVHGGVTLRALEDGRTPVPAEWSIWPSDAVAFEDNASADSDIPSVNVALRGYRGPATVRASYSGQGASLPAFVYDSAAAACFMGYPNGIRFNDTGVAKPSGTPQQSDLFVMGPRNEPHMNALYGCTGAFVTASRHFTIHIPYGGAVIHRGSGIFFGDLRVSAWHNEYTTLPPLQAGDIVVFRLHDGRIAKLLYDPPAAETFGGIYLAGPPRGDFYDYVYFHHVKPVPHAIFGRH